MTATTGTSSPQAMAAGGMARHPSVSADELVAGLVRARQLRELFDPPPQAFTDLSVAQAYELQERHAQSVLAVLGGQVIGRRIGLHDMTRLAALGLSGPARGPIFSATAHRGPATLRAADHPHCRVELALAVRLREDIGGHPYLPGRDVLQHAIDAVIPVLDLVESRLTTPDQRPLPLMLTDLCFGGACVYGDALADWQDLDLSALKLRLFASGQEVRTAGGATPRVDPIQALSLLVADLGCEGKQLRAGDIVSMGPWAPPYVPRAGEVLRGDFGPLGPVELRLA